MALMSFPETSLNGTYTSRTRTITVTWSFGDRYWCTWRDKADGRRTRAGYRERPVIEHYVRTRQWTPPPTFYLSVAQGL